jgi:uncharacterized membrane protein
VEQYEKAKVASASARAAAATIPEAEATDVPALEGVARPLAEEPTRPVSVQTPPLQPGLTPAHAHAVALDYEFDLDPLPPRAPTLSARAWRLAWLFVSRAYRWVGARAHIRVSRH